MTSFVFADGDNNPLVTVSTDNIQVIDESATTRLCGITILKTAGVIFTDFSSRLGLQVICSVDGVVVANGSLYGVRKNEAGDTEETYQLMITI